MSFQVLGLSLGIDVDGLRMRKLKIDDKQIT